MKFTDEQMISVANYMDDVLAELILETYKKYQISPYLCISILLGRMGSMAREVDLVEDFAKLMHHASQTMLAEKESNSENPTIH
jgi:hypothetical protein